MCHCACPQVPSSAQQELRRMMVQAMGMRIKPRSEGYIDTGMTIMAQRKKQIVNPNMTSRESDSHNIEPPLHG